MNKNRTKKILTGLVCVIVLFALMSTGLLMTPKEARSQANQTSCFEIWGLNIAVSDANGNNNLLTIGQGLSATNSVDACDRRSPPPPPNGAFDAWIKYETNSYYADYRPASRPGTITWSIFFQASANGDPITFTWDPAKLPSAGTWILKDAFGGVLVNVDMRTQNSLVVPDTELTQLKIIYTTTRCTVTAITSGNWNSSGTWDTNCSGIPTTTTDVYIPTGVSVDFNDQATTIESLTLGSGATLTFLNSNRLTVTENIINEGGSINLGTLGNLSVNGTLTNNGYIRQTASVGPHCSLANPCHFPNIFNTAGNLLKYYGVDIVPTGNDQNMGSTSVSIYGGQTCGMSGNMAYGVNRCFEITPSIQLAATITFYYLPLEENKNLTPTVWNFHDGSWHQETFEQRGSVDGNLYVRSTGISNYSIFALMQEAPTAVTVTKFTKSILKNSIQLDWETGDEIDLIGFNILRSQSIDGVKLTINDSLIEAKNPGQMLGSEYHYVDIVEQAKGYYYWLEVIKTGPNNLIGPVVVSPKFLNYVPILSN